MTSSSKADDSVMNQSSVNQSSVNQSSVVLHASADDTITVSTNSCTAKPFTAVTTTNVGSNSTPVSMSNYSSTQISIPILTSTETKKSQVINGMETQYVRTYMCSYITQMSNVTSSAKTLHFHTFLSHECNNGANGRHQLGGWDKELLPLLARCLL